MPCGQIGCCLSLPGYLSRHITDIIRLTFIRTLCNDELWVMWCYHKFRTSGEDKNEAVFTWDTSTICMDVHVDGMAVHGVTVLFHRLYSITAGDGTGAGSCCCRCWSRVGKHSWQVKGQAPCLPSSCHSECEESEGGWGRKGEALVYGRSCDYVLLSQSTPTHLLLIVILLEKKHLVWSKALKCCEESLDLQAATVPHKDYESFSFWLMFLTGPPSAIQSLVSCCGWRWFTGGPCVCFFFHYCWSS